MSEFFIGFFLGYSLAITIIIELILLRALQRGGLGALLLRKSNKRKV